MRMAVFIKEKVLLIGNKDKRTAYKLINMVIRVLFVVFVVSLYPAVKKALKAKV